MKFIFCLIICLVLSPSNVDSNAVDFTKKFEEVSRIKRVFLLTVPNFHFYIFEKYFTLFQTKFIDLSLECVFLILENLDFGDLLNVAQINDEFSMLAADVYRRKHSHLQIILADLFSLPDELNNTLSASDGEIDTDAIDRIIQNPSFICNKTANIRLREECIGLRDYATTLNTFKHFGHLIKELHVIRSAPLHLEFVGYLISKYSSDSLVEVAFSSSFDKLLERITKPLINVGNVTFYGTSFNFQLSIKEFDELFPVVRRLELRNFADHNLAYFNCHMPHLEHFLLEQQTASPCILDIIGKNPQIRSIGLYRVDSELLQNVNTLLPQLESLQLPRSKLQSEIIQFENVTTFDIRMNGSPAHLRFPRLQTFYVQYLDSLQNDYVSFLNEHTFLRHLHLASVEIRDSEFQQLTANLADLVEVTIKRQSEDYEYVSFDAIAEFLRSHDKVKCLTAIGFSADWEDNLQEQLKHDWNTKIVDSGLSLERKSNDD